MKHLPSRKEPQKVTLVTRKPRPFCQPALHTFFHQILIVEAVEDGCVERPIGQEHASQHGQLVPL